MIDANTIASVREFGIAVVIILVSLWGLWKIVVPAIVKQYQTHTDYYVAEIRSLREEASKKDALLFDAFNRNTESNVKLQGTLDKVNDQLVELTSEVQTLKNDVTKVYLILGTEKQLIASDRKLDD